MDVNEILDGITLWFYDLVWKKVFSTMLVSFLTHFNSVII